MKKRFVICSCLLSGLVSLAYGQSSSTPTQVGIIHVRNAIISTQEGQQAATDLQTRFESTRKDLDSQQSEIAAMQEQLRKGSNTMNEDMKAKLMRDIDSKSKLFNRAAEDARADFEQEQSKIMQTVGQRMITVIDKYSRDNNYALIIDVSNPESSILYAANGIDITNDIIALYDQGRAPAAKADSPAPAAAKPAAPVK